MNNFFKKSNDYSAYNKWQKENFYVMTMKLHKDNWQRCYFCDGKGSYYVSGDLHKSGGVVPCSCDNGIIKKKIVYVPNNAKFKITLRKKR